MASRPSTHFSWSEFACHDGTPCPGHAHLDVIALCRTYLEPARQHFGPCTVISGYRTPQHNQDVGGAHDSFHLYKADRQGVAADVAFARGGPRDWYAWLDGLHPGGLGLYPGHVHVDNRAGHARW